MGLVDLKSRYDFSLGQIVRIKEGAFENLEGTIEELDTDAEKMKVSVDMFGRETKVELDFAQVDKID